MSKTLDEIRAKLQVLGKHKNTYTGEEHCPWPTYTEEDITAAVLTTGEVFKKAAPINYFEQEVACPYCKQEELHHMGVEMFARGEDANTGEHISLLANGVDGDKIHRVHNHSMHNNASMRRGSILIHFFCEQCQQQPTMFFVQHKGHTYAGWCE